MPTTAEKMIAAHPASPDIFATNKADALGELERIRVTIERMEDFERFPEGAVGTILYAVLKTQSEICPDPADFNYVTQGCALVLDTAFNVIVDEVEWFPRASRQ